MRIGEILDRSFEVARALIPALAPCIVLLAGLSAYIEYQSNDINIHLGRIFLLVGVVIVQMVLSYLFFLVVLFMAGAQWVGTPLTLRGGFERLSIGLIVRNFFLTLRIMFFFLLGLLCFIIPGFVYLVNRMLAYYILTLEDASVSGALERSKFLMTQGRWYSFDSPVMRVSGLLLITFVLSLVVGALNVSGGLLAVYSTPGRTSMLIPTVVSGLLSTLVYVYSSVVMTGFYYDLRARYEGADLPAPPSA